MATKINFAIIRFFEIYLEKYYQGKSKIKTMQFIISFQEQGQSWPCNKSYYYVPRTNNIILILSIYKKLL